MADLLKLNKKNIKALVQQPFFLGLDYDGTLSPIVKNPERAYLPQKVKNTLKKLSRMKNCRLAIVSGRSIKQLRRFVPISGITFVGNHGLEMMKGKERWVHPSVEHSRALLKILKKDLGQLKSLFPGIFLEDKELVLAIHYRNVATRHVSSLEKKLKQIVRPFLKTKKVSLGEGKKVWEIRPLIKWNKGSAIKELLKDKRRAFYRASRYLGDDKTDEDAFHALGKSGVSVFVGKKQKTKARFRLTNPSRVSRFLEMVYETLKERSVS